MKPLASAQGAPALTRYSALWALVVLIIVFGFTDPSVFLTETTLKLTLFDVSIVGVLTVGVIVPFAAGLIDLAFADLAGLSLVTIAWLSTQTRLNDVVIALIGVVVALIGSVISSTVVVRWRVNSLVATLGVGTVALGVAELITNENTITERLSRTFVDATSNYLGPVPYAFLYFLVLAAIVHVCFEYTVLGKRILAIGANERAASLLGLRTARFKIGALLWAGLCAGLAGVLLAGQVGQASATLGPGYLIPGIAALFLGLSQVAKRANVPGLVISVVMLGTGVEGLELLGVPSWINYVFNGGVLLLAVGLASATSGGVMFLRPSTHRRMVDAHVERTEPLLPETSNTREVITST